MAHLLLIVIAIKCIGDAAAQNTTTSVIVMTSTVDGGSGDSESIEPFSITNTPMATNSDPSRTAASDAMSSIGPQSSRSSVTVISRPVAVAPTQSRTSIPTLSSTMTVIPPTLAPSTTITDTLDTMTTEQDRSTEIMTRLTVSSLVVSTVTPTPSATSISAMQSVSSTMTVILPTPSSIMTKASVTTTTEPDRSTEPDTTSTMDDERTETTSEPSNQNIVAAIAVTAVVLLILIVILCGLICCYHMFKSNERRHMKIVEFTLQEVNGDDKLLTQDVLYGHINGGKMPCIPAEKLPAYVSELHRDNCFNAEEEYESIKDKDPEFSKHAASQDCNETKNRYINILPRDETRVVLSAIPKVQGSDYINANYVDGYNHENEYIASQGPLPNTTVDFWRMIWEQNVHIIVMVTNPVENGMVKCHEYWPSRGAGQYGNMVVTTVGEKLFPEFILRKFTLTMNTKNKKVCIAREITQYHFTDWPDFGVPEDASSMLKFVRHVRGATNPTHGPVVVHCSAGVGRTGTFITIDVMLQKMAAKERLNVQEFVCRMRAQRAFMIQTSAQYLFVYDALLHAFIHGCTEIRASLLDTHLASLDKPVSSESEVTVLDREFKHVISMKFPADHFFSIAMEEFNADKNRSVDNLPLDDNRVILESVDDKAAGVDYINASFIDGYYNRIEFIATQHPVASTKGDLWRMVIERDVNTLVVIGALKEESDRYWPAEGTQVYDGGITVEVKDTDELQELKITKRTFNVSMEQGDSFVSVTQFHLHGWPKDGVPTSPDMMLELVKMSRQHWRETGFNLITVHTATNVAGEVSGVYCGVCVLMRQLEVEGCADLVTTAQKLRQKRPSIITIKDYYRFMYEVLVATL